jgi:hypothetical protein
MSRIVVEYNPEELSLKACQWIENNIVHELEGVSSGEKQYYIDSLMCNEELADNITAIEYHYLETLQEQQVDYLAINLID